MWKLERLNGRRYLGRQGNKISRPSYSRSGFLGVSWCHRLADAAA